MFNNMLSSIGSSVLRVKGGSYLQKEAEKAKAQAKESDAMAAQSEAARLAAEASAKESNMKAKESSAKAAAAEAAAKESAAIVEASKSDVIKSQRKSITEDLENLHETKKMDPKEASKFRGKIRKSLDKINDDVWNSYLKEYYRAASKNSVIDRISTLERLRGEKFDFSGGKK